MGQSASCFRVSRLLLSCCCCCCRAYVSMYVCGMRLLHFHPANAFFSLCTACPVCTHGPRDHLLLLHLLRLFQGSECVVDVDRAPTHLQKGPKTSAKGAGEAKQQLHAHACAADQQQAVATAQPQQQCGSGTDDQQRAAPAADRKLDPSLACCLGAALQPNGIYDVTTSGPPLPGCEPDRWVLLLPCVRVCVVGGIEPALVRLKITSAPALCGVKVPCSPITCNQSTGDSSHYSAQATAQRWSDWCFALHVLLCRLEQSHLSELLDFAPKEELQNILALVCNMFSVENALVSLFFDRRVYIIDGTGAFTVSEGSVLRAGYAIAYMRP